MTGVQTCALPILLQHRNECCSEYQIETEFDPPVLDVETQDSLPLIPSIGVIWKF